MSVEKFRPIFSNGKVRHERKPYTQVLNRVLQECDNLEAIGLWCHFQSKPENWDISVQYVQNAFNIGRDKAYKLFKFLIDSNLMEYRQDKNLDGTFGDKIYIIKNGEEFKRISDELSTEKAPLPDLPYTDLPLTENPTTTNESIYTNKTILKNEGFKKPEQKQIVKFWEPGNPDYDRVNGITPKQEGRIASNSLTTGKFNGKSEESWT